MVGVCLARLAAAEEQFGGRIWDFTANGASDLRIDAPSLGQKRDVYAYTPPGFDWNGTVRYPLLIWLHGARGDERDFLTTIAPTLDRAIRRGECPPVVAVAPDGSLEGQFPVRDLRDGGTGSWFVNSSRGRFADYITQDVVAWAERRFPIQSGRDSRILSGWSMGGFAAFNLGIKHRDQFRAAAGISPPLNMRYVDLDNNYQADFQPGRWALRSSFWATDEVLATFNVRAPVLGVFRRHVNVPITAELWFGPVWGLGREGVEFVSRENPVELIGRTKLRPGELDMFVAYSKSDPLNIDAQVESFTWLARESRIPITVVPSEFGGHDDDYLRSALPKTIEWVGTRLKPDATTSTEHGPRRQSFTTNIRTSNENR